MANFETHPGHVTDIDGSTVQQNRVDRDHVIADEEVQPLNLKLNVS